MSSQNKHISIFLSGTHSEQINNLILRRFTCKDFLALTGLLANWLYLNMLQILKRIILFIYLLLKRWSKRKILLENLAPKYKKQKLDIAELPAVLDELKQLPKEFSDNTSLSGFDSHGLCISVKSRKVPKGLRCIQLDLDIPGFGYFYHKELVPDFYGLGRTCLICLDPMRRWQVQFQGLLRNVNAGGKKVNGSILLYWHALSDPYDSLLSPSCWSLAGTLSCLSWRTIVTIPIFANGIFYNQWGELRGRIRIEGHEEIKVKLKSVREREIKHKDTHMFNDVIQQHFILKESGLSISQQATNFASESIYFGRVTFPIADSTPSALHHVRGSIADEPIKLLKFPQQIKTCSNTYDVHEKLTRHCFGDPMIGFAFNELVVNSKPGYGIEINKTNQNIITNDENWSISTPSIHGISTKVISSSEHEIVSLDNASLMSRSLVGGKAYYLGLVKSSDRFKVPKGLVLTTKVFENHVMVSSSWVEASRGIKSCLADCRLELLQQQCEQAVNNVKEILISEKLQADIKSQLCLVFGDDWYEKSFAVRSSSIGEDSVQTSAAGQLDTSLCIQGLDNIISAVIDCWASTVAYQAVEYRRQNGQELLESLGVIIQEMVNSEVSGVVFTMDPVENDASNLIITANYGLGESVVSGDVDADTIAVDRHDEDKLLINKLQKGKKETKTITEGGEVKTMVTSEMERNAFCMGYEQILLLSKQAIELENAFGTYLDIEWAIKEGSLYILQVRPITSIDLTTDDDLIHEFDNPLANDNVLISPCNIQEMMPGAVPTLTADLFVRAADTACKYFSCSRIGLPHPAHATGAVPFYSGFAFINLTHFDTRPITCFGDGAKADFEQSMVGQEVAEHSLQTVKDFIGRPITMWQRIMSNIRIFFTLKRHDSDLFDRLRRQSETFEIGGGANNSKSLYGCIDDSLIFYFEMCRAYLFKASESVVPAGMAIMCLKKGAKNISTKTMADMALILADCGGVVSAEFPLAIRDLSESIAKSNIKEQFLATPTEDCDTLLRNSANNEIKAAYVHFMEMYGYRGIREADLMEKSWSQDPRNLIESVKQVINNGTFKRQEKQTKTAADIVNSLEANLTWLQKLVLKWILVKSAKDGVASRETGKSVLIKTTDIFKVAYWRLAELMVSESRLPEQELLFFLTHREIGDLIDSRSATLIRLAKRRKRIFPDRKNYTFPKFSFGYPESLQEDKKELEILPSFTLHGMPVCRGKAEGRACVIKTLDDVSKLKAGDVMICKYTDVGWSPYFPMISGLVTEIGGLVSHGAVVARECGIPSIVNTANATDMICTGDHVVVDGTAGTVSKV